MSLRGFQDISVLALKTEQLQSCQFFQMYNLLNVAREYSLEFWGSIFIVKASGESYGPQTSA